MELFESLELTALISCSCCWMKSEVYKIKVDTADELLVAILYVAGCVKKREDGLRRAARDLHTRVTKCTEVGGRILGNICCGQ